MKKFALFTIAMAFIFGVNAQSISVGKIDSKMYMAPKEKSHGIMPADKPLKKAYEALGWVNTTSYLNYLLPSDYELNGTTFILFPDSCMNNIDDRVGEITVNSTWMHAMGNSFDPYSESFDRMFADGLLPTPLCHTDEYDGTYGYKVDSIAVRYLYYWGERNGYNAASPDTLRAYLSYHKTYEWEGRSSEWVALHWTSDQNQDTALFAPLVKIDTNIVKQSKGTAISPNASSCITIDYILSAADSTYYWDSIDANTGDTARWFRYTTVEFPTTLNGATENGFEVPAGAVLSCIFKYIPGYDYQLGDTMMYGKVNSENYYEKGYPKYINNCFRIYGYYEKNNDKAFCDPWGYNFNFFEHRYGRYQTWSSALYNRMYYPTAQHLPLAFYKISTDDQLVKVVDSNSCVGVAEAKEMIEAIYPNPANDVVTVSLKNNEPSHITIYNVMGQAVKDIYATEAKTSIKINDLSAGMYIISVEQNGLRFNSKFSKN